MRVVFFPGCLLYFNLYATTSSFYLLLLFFSRFLEDLAIKTDYVDNIKLLEGLTLAGETLVGEVIFFPLSGALSKIIIYIILR